MSNTSATGGYLAPTGTAPEMDDAFEDQLQAMVAGITGLAGASVRPRWQGGNPKMPEIGTDWCAIGITTITPDYTASVVHDASEDGSDNLQAHSTVDLLASFYGPNAQGYAERLKDGLQIEQNREAMAANGLFFYDSGDLIRAPTMLNNKWANRWDIQIRLRRRTDRTYPVLNILSVEGEISANVEERTITSAFIIEP